MIGVDTGVLIDLFRGNKKLTALLSNLNEKAVLTRVSYLELMFGIDPSEPKHKSEEEHFDNLFDEYELLELDKESAKKSSSIFWFLKKQGKMIEQFDCVIAGILLSNGVNRIITRNAKHFVNIRGLDVISY